MSMVSMSELIVVMSADTADLVHFLFFFFTSAAWVATREAEIFTAVCRICRGAVTLDGALRDVAEPRIAPHRQVRDVLVDGRRRRPLHVRCVTDLVTAPVLIAEWCRAPVDAITVLHNKMQKFN
jgi:hypothetical protein